MSKLTVVYLKDTGHVLAALTRADPPQPANRSARSWTRACRWPSVDGAPADFTVPVTNLDAVTVDDISPMS